MKYVGIFMLFLVAAIVGLILLAPEEVVFQVNEDINAPVQEVFHATTSASELQNWINGVESVNQIKGNGAEVRAEYELHFKGEGDMVINHKINLIEANKQYAYTGTVTDFMEVNSNTTYEALDSNTTRISTKMRMKPLGIKFKMFMYLEETHKKNAAANYTRLKEYLEK